MEREKQRLEELILMEDLAEKKAKIHSRLLTEPALAQEMESLAKRHAERKNRLKTLLTGEQEETDET